MNIQDPYRPPGVVAPPPEDPHRFGRRLLLAALIAYLAATVFWTVMAGAVLMLALRVPLQGYLCFALYTGAGWARVLFVIFTLGSATLILWWNPLSIWVGAMAVFYLLETALVLFHPEVTDFIRAQRG